MTTLENSYCVPKTEEEWDMLYPKVNWLGRYPSKNSHVCWYNNGKYLASWPNEDPNRTEIPVQHFLDLVEDRITPWRLGEIGFNMSELPYFIRIEAPNEMHTIQVTETGKLTFINGKNFRGITTFTDLLTLIKFLTPPAK